MARVAICSPSEERGNANLIYEVYMRNTTNNLIYWVVMHRRERGRSGPEVGKTSASILYTFPAGVSPGLARDCHLRFPRI
jgi:hypothetical protein